MNVGEHASKLTEVLADDMTDLHDRLSDFEGHDVIFLCHGTTRGAAKSNHARVTYCGL